MIGKKTWTLSHSSSEVSRQIKIKIAYLFPILCEVETISIPIDGNFTSVFPFEKKNKSLRESFLFRICHRNVAIKCITIYHLRCTETDLEIYWHVWYPLKDDIALNRDFKNVNCSKHQKATVCLWPLNFGAMYDNQRM